MNKLLLKDSHQVEVDFICPAVPSRSHDWRATFTGYDEGAPLGYGATPAEAVADLYDQAAE